jgi:AraC family transcriptional regulator
MIYDFSALPLIRVDSRYKDRKFHLHALTALSGHSRETTVDYYLDGNRRHVSSYMVWQYTISGRGRIKKNRKSEDILPGTMMLVAVPGEEIYYLPRDSEYWEFVFLTMVGKESFRTVKLVESHRGNLIPRDDIPKTMELFHSFVFDLFSQNINTSFSNSSRSYALCMSILEETWNPDVIKELYSFEELLVMLHDNLYRDIPIEEMAGFMRLSRSHFTRLFARNMGISPREYLEDIRLKAAISMLQNESLNIKEAASRVGIRDENYFCRIFKKHYGLSPGKLKNRSLWE